MITRRTLVSSGALAALSAGFAPRIAFAVAPTEQRFVFIIQRGAADGLNTVVPYADPAYCALRGVSVLYTEYLQNMGVSAGLTMPLRRDDVRLETSPMEGGRYLPGCAACAERARCSGLRDDYLAVHGGAEFVPITGT